MGKRVWILVGVHLIDFLPTLSYRSHLSPTIANDQRHPKSRNGCKPDIEMIYDHVAELSGDRGASMRLLEGACGEERRRPSSSVGHRRPSGVIKSIEVE